MKLRLLILVFLLMLRLAGGWLEVASFTRGKMVKVAGKAIIIDQSQSICQISIGRWNFKLEGKCPFSQTAEIAVVGRVDFQLIDMFLGRLWLMEPEIMSIQTLETQDGWIDRELRGMREKVIKILRLNLNEPESGLVAGIVLGYKDELPYQFNQQLIASGTVHVVVASGYNVMIIAGVVMAFLFWGVKRKAATVIAVTLIWFYTLICGLSAPVVRAAVMGSMVLGGRAMGRGTATWWSLTVACWLMVMIDPLILTSISFQLSVGATAGMVTLADWLKKRSVVIEKTGLSESMAAQAWTLPLIWWHFGRWSLVGLISNIFIVPLIPIVMALGGVMIGLGLIWLPLSRLMMVPVYAVTHLMVVLVEVFG